MLVLARRVNEGVVVRIGDQILRVSLVKVMGDDRARIGFEADEIIEIYRDEVYEEILKEGKRGLAQGNPRTGE